MNKIIEVCEIYKTTPKSYKYKLIKFQESAFRYSDKVIKIIDEYGKLQQKRSCSGCSNVLNFCHCETIKHRYSNI